MSRKIIGVTVGTSLSPSKIDEKLKPVKTVNGVAPDETGNVNTALVYMTQNPQEDGTFAFEQGKKYKIYAPSENGKFICIINLTKEEFREGGISVHSNYALVTNIPCNNNADSFVFELLSVDNSMGTYYYSYMIDNTIYDKDKYEGSYVVIHPHGCISGATKVGVSTDEAFINPEGESNKSGVHVGADEPTDDSVIWIDTDEEEEEVGFATTEYVNNAINELNIPTEDSINRLIDNAIGSLEIPSEDSINRLISGAINTLDIPTDEDITTLINNALGVIENGTY